MTLPSSPSLDAARQELVGLIDAAVAAWDATHPSAKLAVEDDNRNTVDLASPEAQRPVLAWQIRFGSARQVSLGSNALVRQYGQLYVVAKTKDGSGTSGVLQLLDHVVPFVERKELSVVQTFVAEVHPDKLVQGWYCLPMLLNFWITRTA